jgi:hypothetical protein
MKNKPVAMWAIKDGNLYIGKYTNWVKNLNKALLYSKRTDALCDAYTCDGEKVVKVLVEVKEFK